MKNWLEMSRGVARRATGPRALVCWLIAALIFLQFGRVDPTAPELGPDRAVRQGDFLDLRLHYTAREARDTLDRYGEAGRARYRQFLALDVLFAAAYGLALALTLSLAARRAFGSATRLMSANLVPLAATLADFAENLCLLRALNAYPDISTVAGTLGGWITASKQLLLALSVLGLFAFGMTILAKKIAGGRLRH